MSGRKVDIISWILKFTRFDEEEESDWKKEKRKTKFKFHTSSLFSPGINSTWTLLIRWQSAFKRLETLTRASTWVTTLCNDTGTKSSHCQQWERILNGIYSRISVKPTVCQQEARWLHSSRPRDKPPLFHRHRDLSVNKNIPRNSTRGIPFLL